VSQAARPLGVSVAAARNGAIRTQIQEATAALRSALGARRPSVAIVLGSGLGYLADRLRDPLRIGYRDIPHFPLPTVVGHAGEIVCGTLAGKMVLAQSGRFHLYEGHSAQLAALPVRIFAALGIRTLILTNAAGGIRRTFSRGVLMMLADHINLTFQNPLTGAVLPGATVTITHNETKAARETVTDERTVAILESWASASRYITSVAPGLRR